MSNALQLIQHPDRQIMDLQGNVQRAVSQLQASALVDAKVLTVVLPVVVGDIALVHNFGRPLNGYLLARVPPAAAGLTLYDSPNVSPMPNVSFLVLPLFAAPSVGPAITLTVVVF